MNLGKLHVVIVHFPIALAVAAVAADLLWLATRRMVFRSAGAFCLAAAVIVTPAVIATGWLLANSLNLPPDLADLAEDHENMALVSFGVMAAAAAVRLLWHKTQVKWQIAVYGVLMAALFVCISITGHWGGLLAFGKDYLADVFF